MPARKPSSKGMRTTAELRAAVSTLQRRDRERAKAMKRMDGDIDRIEALIQQRHAECLRGDHAIQSCVDAVNKRAGEAIDMQRPGERGDSLRWVYGIPSLPTTDSAAPPPAASGTALERARTFFGKLFGVRMENIVAQTPSKSFQNGGAQQ